MTLIRDGALRLLLGLALSHAAVAARAGDSPHLKMGNPSNATADTSNNTDFLMEKEFFTLSYNENLGTPNWVGWRLSKEDIGHAPRKPFRPDPDLPEGFTRITPEDYAGSGFDRGHMCPHSDRTKTAESSAATFVMTNMVPQSPQNNQGAWNQLEIYLRDIVVNEGKVCYIVAGPQGRGGVGRNGFKVTTPTGQVVVPNKTWKVVLVLDEDVSDPNQITEDTNVRLIAVVMPNDRSVGLDWSEYRVTVKDVERLTRFKFFDKVKAEVIDPLKGIEDDFAIPPPVPAHHSN